MSKTNNTQTVNMFPTVEMLGLSGLTGKPTRKGLENVILSDGQIVNVVSNSYGLIKNEDFFLTVEESLINADIEYTKREINRENRSFSTDYILQSDKYAISIGNKVTTKHPDKLNPMLRFTTSYDGSCKASGHLAIYRQVCSNGLHALANTEIGFKAKHRGDVMQIILPEIGSIVDKFLNNQYFTVKKRFEVLAETPIKDLKEFVKLTTESLKLFMYEASENNPEPSLNARLVIETIEREANTLGMRPNLWLGYNAFNELLHDKLKKTFDQQRTIDAKLFSVVESYS